MGSAATASSEVKMVKETRIIFEVGDVRAVRIECAECGGETLYTIGKQDRPNRCAACGYQWNDQGAGYRYPLVLMDMLNPVFPIWLKQVMR